MCSLWRLLFNVSVVSLLVTGGRPRWHCQPDGPIWDVPAGEVSLPVCAGCSQHTQVAKSLLAVDTELAVPCLMFSPTVSCQIPLAKPCHAWGSCWSSGLGAVRWKDAVSHRQVSTPGSLLFLWDSPLSAHLCSLQECPDPGAFVNITESCTVY